MPPASAAGWLPTGAGEKIICLKNQNDLGLINGMFLTLDDVVDEGSHYFSAVVTDEDGNRIGATGAGRQPRPAAHLQGPLRGPHRLRPASP